MLLPALAASDAWCALPGAAQVTRSAHPLHAHPPPSPHPSTRHLPRQLFLTCAWTCGTVSVVLLLPARAFVERVGFIGGDQGCPDGTALARGTALLVLAYAGLLGAGYLANEKLQTGARINRTLSEVRAR